MKESNMTKFEKLAILSIMVLAIMTFLLSCPEDVITGDSINNADVFIAFTDTAAALISKDDGVWTKVDMTGDGFVKIMDVAIVGNYLLGIDKTTNNVVWRSDDQSKKWIKITVDTLTVPFSPFTHITASGNDVLVSGANDTLNEYGYYSADGGKTWGAKLNIYPNAGSTGSILDLGSNIVGNTTYFYLSQSGSPYFKFTSAPETLPWSSAQGFGGMPVGNIALSDSTIDTFRFGAGTSLCFSGNGGGNFASGPIFPGNEPSITYANGMFMIAQHNGSGSNICYFRRSASGAGTAGDWTTSNCTECTSDANARHVFYSVAGGNGRFVSGGKYDDDFATDYPILLHSENNGVTWNKDTLPATGTATQISKIIFISN
jgi:hypothetical protein